jgi:hypothetical protein
MAKKNIVPESQDEYYDKIEWAMLDFLKKKYGPEAGEKKFDEIEKRAEERLEALDKEGWHKRNERERREKIDEWKEHLRGMSIPDLVAMREKVKADVRKKRKRILLGKAEEYIYLEAEAFLEAIEETISEGPPKLIWDKGKGEFADFVNKIYDENPDKYGYNRRRATKELFKQYKFPEYPDWTWEQCYDLVKRK